LRNHVSLANSGGGEGPGQERHKKKAAWCDL
jgi:hypothetical protein